MIHLKSNPYEDWQKTWPAKWMSYIYYAGWLLAIPISILVWLVFDKRAESDLLWNIGVLMFIPHMSMTMVWLKRGIQLKRRLMFELRVRRITAETLIEILAPDEAKKMEKTRQIHGSGRKSPER